MATVGSKFITYADWAQRQDPNGSTAEIIEVLSEDNPIVEDMMVLECNDGTKHKTTMRTGLPSATWRKMYQGVQPSKSQTAQVDDACGMLETYSEIDVAMVNLNGNSNDFRLSEDSAFLESMTQEMARNIFYGDEDGSFLGLATRYNTLNKDKAKTAENVIDAGGTGSRLTSIWVIGWGAKSIHGIFPKGSKAGLQTTDKGQQTITKEDGSKMEAMVTHFKWDNGISVRDWRYAVRIANIDLDLLEAGTLKLEDLIIKAKNKMPTKAKTPKKAGASMKTCIYLNGDIHTYLEIQANNKANVHLSYKDFGGIDLLHAGGLPIRQTDAIINNEERVL